MTLGTIHAHENIPSEIFFWSSHGAGFAKSLKNDEWKIVDSPVVEGYRCYHLQRVVDADKSQRRYELIISPRQSYLPISYSVYYADKLSWSHTLKRLKKTANGKWYPSQVVRKDTFMSRDYDARVRTFDPNYEFPKLVETEVPLGVHVRDNLTGRVYINDPWWPEIGTFMNNEFKWPPVDLTPLRSAQSYCDESIDGVDAIPLKPAKWIQGEPVTLAERKGKVTLLRFSSASLYKPAPAQTAALRHVYDTMRPNGLEVIEIFYDGSSPDEIKSAIEELRIPWPVVLDQESKGYGKTFDAYKLKASVSWILIDKDGKVRTVSDGTLAKQLVELLTESNDKEVSPIHFEFVRQPREMAQAATSVVPFPRYTYKTKSNAAGEYELDRLVKGTYRLTFSLPGGQSVQREVSVGGKDKPAVVNLDTSE